MEPVDPWVMTEAAYGLKGLLVVSVMPNPKAIMLTQTINEAWKGHPDVPWAAVRDVEDVRGVINHASSPTLELASG